MSSLSKPKIVQLILAAGSSSRMGEPKQLLPWGETTLISHAIMQSLAIEKVLTYVVLGANYKMIHKEINHFAVTILKNPDWQLGMGSSIRFGIQTILQDELSYDAVLISLIDQPLLGKHHFNRLITEFNTNPNYIVASDLGSRIGVPAIFPASLFKELEDLKEDFGARYIIKKYMDVVKTISTLDKGVDIDTVEEYQRIIQNKLST